jgi:glycerophosphodiester phosphodiesterase
MSIGLNSFYVVRTFNKNPFESIAIFHETKITAHRGSSIKAPENTMAAFELAVENMTDFIELDVQLTSDNVPVIMHDRSLYRTTGVNAKVSELTYSQIRELDAGSYFGKEFAGEKVPSLEEVLRFVKGKARLNIELKSGDTVYTADKVAELIQKYDMQNDCVITSFDYNMLKRVKELTDDIQVGYILSIAYGDFYSMDDVDFFSMNASFLSKQIVDAIHNSGKQVYAWTVNNAISIKNLTNKGVDNIITDDPVLARETIYSRDTSETLVNMAKYVFNQ